MAHAYASGLMRKRKIAPPPGADTFTRFLCEKGPAEIASATGKSRALVYAWIHGRSKPKPKDLEAIGYTPSRCDFVTEL
jgi:predicted DNA-binding transcriptional regulator AlpA